MTLKNAFSQEIEAAPSIHQPFQSLNFVVKSHISVRQDKLTVSSR